MPLFTIKANIWECDTRLVEMEDTSLVQDIAFINAMSMVKLMVEGGYSGTVGVYVSTNIGAPDDMIYYTHVWEGEVDKSMLQRMHMPYDDMSYVCTHGCVDRF